MQTLDELRAENAAGEQQPELEPVEQPEQEETETEEQSAEAQGEQETEEVEEWLKDTSQAVPLAKHVELKHKLKARISEKDDELKKLRQEVEALRSGAVQPQQAKPAMPKLSDFDFDEDRHAQAMAEYFASIAQNTLSQSQATEQQRLAQQKLEQAVDGHYERAADLIKSGKIDAEKYQTADKRVRVELGNLFGNLEQGDAVTDTMLARLGAGSEKVMVHLGVNSTALNELKTKLREDPTGLDAMLYLGELKAKFNAQTNKLSKAPKPDTPLTGDVSVGSLSAAGLEKAYKAALDKNDGQKAYDLKRAAKAKGVNTSNW